MARWLTVEPAGYRTSVRRIWVQRDIDAPAAVVWNLLTDTGRWPDWGPSVRAAEIDGATVRPGSAGRVRTVGGVTLPFVITDVVEGYSWSWDVVGFGVPWVVAPYVAVCELALRRLDALATG